MAFYDYLCLACYEILEVQHGFNDTPDLTCKCGSKEFERLISNVNVNTKSGKTLRQERFITSQKQYIDKRTDLRENYGVHEVKVLPDGKTFNNVYEDIKRRGTDVKEQMKKTVEETQKKTDIKLQENRERAFKNRESRIKVIKERQAQEKYEARKLGDVSSKRKK